MKTTAVLRECLLSTSPKKKDAMILLLDKFVQGAENAKATACEIECEHGMFVGTYDLIAVLSGCGSGPDPKGTIAYYPVMIAAEFAKTGLFKQTVSQLTEDILAHRQKK